MPFKIALYNPNGGRFILDIKMENVPRTISKNAAYINYHLLYLSSKSTEPKILQSDSGDNDQQHDDFFDIINKHNPSEPISNVEKRKIRVDFDIDFILKDFATVDVIIDYKIIVSLYQATDTHGISPQTKISEIKIEDIITNKNDTKSNSAIFELSNI